VLLSHRAKPADAQDRVVDVLRKLVANSCADLFIRLAGQPVRSREAAEVGHGLEVPDDEATVHGLKASTERALGRLNGLGKGR
jgi:hypothetical protein